MVAGQVGFNALTELLKVVDRLTVVVPSAVWQDFGEGNRATRVTQVPLIRLLRESITSNIGGTESGGTLPNQRNILDADALQKYDELEIAVLQAFKNLTASVPYLTPEQNLRQVYLAIANAHRSGKISEDALLDHLATWSTWVRTIEDKIWPPVSLEILAECPIAGCGKRRILNKDGDSIASLTVEYRPPADSGSNALSASVGRCRACQTVWRGDLKLRELAYAISHEVEAE
jgi:hypothetical protein